MSFILGKALKLDERQTSVISDGFVYTVGKGNRKDVIIFTFHMYYIAHWIFFSHTVIYC